MSDITSIQGFISGLGEIKTALKNGDKSEAKKKYKRLKHIQNLKSFIDLFNKAENLLKKTKVPKDIDEITKNIQFLKNNKDFIVDVDSNIFMRVLMRILPQIKKHKTQTIDSLRLTDINKLKRNIGYQRSQADVKDIQSLKNLPTVIQEHANKYSTDKTHVKEAHLFLDLIGNKDFKTDAQDVFRALINQLRKKKDPNDKTELLQKHLLPFLKKYAEKYEDPGKKVILRAAIAAAKDLMPNFYVELYKLSKKSLSKVKKDELVRGSFIIEQLNKNIVRPAYGQVKTNISKQEEFYKKHKHSKDPDIKTIRSILRNKKFTKKARGLLSKLNSELKKHHTSDLDIMKSVVEKLEGFISNNKKLLGVEELTNREYLLILIPAIIAGKNSASEFFKLIDRMIIPTDDPELSPFNVWQTRLSSIKEGFEGAPLGYDKLIEKKLDGLEDKEEIFTKLKKIEGFEKDARSTFNSTMAVIRKDIPNEEKIRKIFEVLDPFTITWTKALGEDVVSADLKIPILLSILAVSKDQAGHFLWNFDEAFTREMVDANAQYNASMLESIRFYVENKL